MLGKSILLWLCMTMVCMTMVTLAASDVFKVCPKGFTSVSDKCYRFTSNPSIWSKSDEECATYMAQLASYDSEILIKSVTKHFHQEMHEIKHFWIGLRQNESSGAYEWSDGSQFTVQNWANGEPNRLKGEHCVVSYPDGHWNDEICEKALFGLCAREATPMRVDISKQKAALLVKEQNTEEASAPPEDKLSATDPTAENILNSTPPKQPPRYQPDAARVKHLLKTIFTLALILAVCRCIVSIIETGINHAL